jgi:hypothetical protein
MLLAAKPSSTVVDEGEEAAPGGRAFAAFTALQISDVGHSRCPSARAWFRRRRDALGGSTP